MNFEGGNKYRGRAVQAQLVEIPNDKRTLMIEVLLEVTIGPLIGRRIRWRGYINTPENAERYIAELRHTGWRGERIGNWQGLTQNEVEFSVVIDEGTDGDGKPKKYARAAFLSPVPTLNAKNPAPAERVDDVNKRFAHLLRPPASSSAQHTSPPMAGPLAPRTSPNGPGDLGSYDRNPNAQPTGDFAEAAQDEIPF